MAASGSMEAGQPVVENQPNIGARLRSAREAQNLSLDDVSAELRISAPALAALEENRFEALGAPVFAKGYLKQYGARLGLAIDELAADYELSVGDASVRIAPSKTIKLRDESQITLWIVSGLLLALLMVFLALWWLRQSGPAAVEPVVGDAPVSGAVAPESPAPGGAGEPALPEAAAEPEPPPDTPAAAAEPTAAAAEASGDAPAEATTEAGTDTPTDTPNAAGEAAPADAPNAAPAAGNFVLDGPTLEVVFVEDSWAEITSGDGARLFYALGEAGTRQRFPADPDLNLLFGNAGGVDLIIDGRAVVIPGSPRRGEVAQFALATLID